MQNKNLTFQYCCGPGSREEKSQQESLAPAETERTGQKGVEGSFLAPPTCWFSKRPSCLTEVRVLPRPHGRGLWVPTTLPRPGP